MYIVSTPAEKSSQAHLLPLGLQRIWIVYPGSRKYDVDDTIAAIPLASVPTLADELRRS